MMILNVCHHGEYTITQDLTTCSQLFRVDKEEYAL